MKTLSAMLNQLLVKESKHYAYQMVHPSLQHIFGQELPAIRGRYESERFDVMSKISQFSGARVLDIGANTGFFSFAALANGASEVISYEGNTDHAKFIKLAAGAIRLESRLLVRPVYYDFHHILNSSFDIGFCLNVLHHLGDDFGDPCLSLYQARHSMIESINGLAHSVKMLWLQIGFNWKGKVELPMFINGTKSELIEFVRIGTAKYWTIEEILVFDPRRGIFNPLSLDNCGRYDELGEFLNRPLFLMSSRIFDRRFDAIKP